MLIHTAHNTNYALKDTKILYQKIPSQSIVLRLHAKQLQQSNKQQLYQKLPGCHRKKPLR